MRKGCAHWSAAQLHGAAQRGSARALRLDSLRRNSARSALSLSSSAACVWCPGQELEQTAARPHIAQHGRRTFKLPVRAPWRCWRPARRGAHAPPHAASRTRRSPPSSRCCFWSVNNTLRFHRLQLRAPMAVSQPWQVQPSNASCAGLPRCSAGRFPPGNVHDQGLASGAGKSRKQQPPCQWAENEQQHSRPPVPDGTGRGGLLLHLPAFAQGRAGTATPGRAARRPRRRAARGGGHFGRHDRAPGAEMRPVHRQL